MTMQVWQQEEWHGMARRGVEKKDPYTSKLEVNTQPGVDRLEKLTARKPYLSSKLPAPACRWEDFCGIWQLYDTDDAALTFDKNGERAEISVCFKIDDYNALDVNVDYILFCSGSGPGADTMAWGLYLHYDSGSWYPYFQARDGADVKCAQGTVALVSGSWYWANGAIGTTTLYLWYYKDGGTAAIDAVTDTGLTRPGFTMTTGYVTIGGSYSGDTPLYNGSIAYACLNDYGQSPTKWYADFSLSGGYKDCVFYPFNPRQSIQPAVLNDYTNKYHWKQRPRPGIEVASVTSATSSLYNASGVKTSGSGGYIFHSPVPQGFTQKTVFTFFAKWTGEPTFLRSYDAAFAIFAAGSALNVRYPPADPAQGHASWGGLTYQASSAVLAVDDYNWFAVEVDPTNQGEVNNINIYKYNTATNVWDDINSPGFPIGHGVLSVDLSECVFAEGTPGFSELELYDFRMIVGDEGWATAHQIADITQTPPPGLVSWLNQDTSSRWPLLDNVSSLYHPQSPDLVAPPIAVSDRIDGNYRFRKDHFLGGWSWDGCPYLKNGMQARVEDMAADADGVIEGCSDSFYFNNIVAGAQKSLTSDGKAQISIVGTHRYITGAAPLQRVTDISRSIGWHRAEMDCHDFNFSAGAATLDYKGQLDWSGDYVYKVTHYDAITGNESNAYGPFRFTTDTVPSTTAPPYGTIGCAFTVQARIYTAQNLRGENLRYYRYHSADGAYYLEGDSNITEQTWDSGLGKYYWNSLLTFALSDDDLSLQKELEYDNDSPPLHVGSVIWGGRAFFVDAIRPSRIYFSKMYQFASVPRVNVLWTDEGAGGEILGFLPGMGGLLVLRERSIWIIPEFATEDAAYVQPLIPDTGCVSGAAAVFAEGILWFASPGGVYSFDGQQVINHSERLDGIDRKVWAHAPRLTTCYYDKYNWRIVFACDGLGLSINARTGAAALVSAPERCSIGVNTAAYSGPVFGADGMIWKEHVDNNNSLSLSTAGSMSDYAQEKAVGVIPTHAWYWNDGSSSGSVFSAVCSSRVPTAADANKEWLTPTSCIGRVFSNFSTAKDSGWSHTLHAVTSPTSAIVRTKRSVSEEYYFECVPMYYESQDLFLGRMGDGRYYERMDFLTGNIAGSPTTYIEFRAMVPGTAVLMTASAATAIDSKQEHQLPIRSRGNQAYYTIFCDSQENIPEIMSLGIHFRVSPPRGRGK